MLLIGAARRGDGHGHSERVLENSHSLVLCFCRPPHSLQTPPNTPSSIKEESADAALDIFGIFRGVLAEQTDYSWSGKTQVSNCCLSEAENNSGCTKSRCKDVLSSENSTRRRKVIFCRASPAWRRTALQNMTCDCMHDG